MKIKTIKLKPVPAHLGWPRYRVEQITDSIEYQTGDYLDRRQVERLCESDKWKVTIIPSDLL